MTSEKTINLNNKQNDIQLRLCSLGLNGMILDWMEWLIPDRMINGLVCLIQKNGMDHSCLIPSLTKILTFIPSVTCGIHSFPQRLTRLRTLLPYFFFLFFPPLPLFTGHVHLCIQLIIINLLYFLLLDNTSFSQKHTIYGFNFTVVFFFFHNLVESIENKYVCVLFNTLSAFMGCY